MTDAVFELTTLSCPLPAVATVARAALAWTAEGAAAGNPIGCWRSEIGRLGQVVILRGFPSRAALDGERDRALASERPFGADGSVCALEMESFAPFPFLPPVRTGIRGGTVELRRYRLRPGGLPQTLAGWRDAIGPAKAYTDHLVVAMLGLDGPPRIVHLWAFDDLAQRAALRAWGYGAGVWPPRGGPEAIAEAISTILLPEPGSPLR